MNIKYVIISPVRNEEKYIEKTIQSVINQTVKPAEWIIVDDGSTDGTSEAIEKDYPELVLLKGDGNFWWTKSINTCIKYVLENYNDTDFILTLNDDLVINNGYIAELISCAKEYPASLN